MIALFAIFVIVSIAYEFLQQKFNKQRYKNENVLLFESLWYIAGGVMSAIAVFAGLI